MRQRSDSAKLTSNSRLQSAKKDQKEEKKQVFNQKQTCGGGGGGLRTTAKFGGDEEFEGDMTNDDFQVALQLHLEELEHQEKSQVPYNRHNPFDMRIRTNAPLVDVCESADDPNIFAAI